MIVNKQFLPISMNDLKERNIAQLDFIIITGLKLHQELQIIKLDKSLLIMVLLLLPHYQLH